VSTSSAPILEFRTVTRTWRAGILGATSEVTALQRVSFSMRRGEVIAITGAAGAGKSTLLLLAAAQVAPTDGTVRWCGVHDASLARPQLIGPRPWEYNFLTVRQAIAFQADVLALRDSTLPRPTRFVPLMKDVGLRGMSKVRLGQLSAIDQLRVVVAQALLAEPRLICCEEPMGFCGPKERLEAVRLLRMVADRGIALLIATREENTMALLGVADRSIHLAQGRVTSNEKSTRSVLELAVVHAEDAAARLAARLPSMTRRGRRLRVPLAHTTPEAVLAACRDAGVTVRASRVAEERLSAHLGHFARAGAPLPPREGRP
jgi:ABC-type multidrug transport system ATPase subunit